jgi:hypothetical protein
LANTKGNPSEVDYFSLCCVLLFKNKKLNEINNASFEKNEQE